VFLTYWVKRLILANAVVFVLQMVRPGLTNLLAFVPALVVIRPWTLVTYMFTHGGFGHILFNMLALFFFGPRLEMEIGSRHFIALYFVSGIMGALFSFLTPFSAIIGASGAVFGVMLVFAIYWPRELIYIWGIFGIEARWFVVVMTVLSLAGGLGVGGAGIAHLAHLGGFAGGFLYLKWMRRPVRERAMLTVTNRPPSSEDVERWMKIPRDSLHEVNRAELDRVVEKIKTWGPASLTPSEREFLDRFSS
jgi:membrane associated rhomboid family serine protease